MGNLNFGAIAKGMKITIKKHSPEILTGIGITGMVTATILAVKATPKALILIEKELSKQNQILRDEAEENGCEECKQVSKLSVIEMMKTTWICYIPAGVTGILSVGCLIGANSVHIRRRAALVAAYSLSESALKEYQEKVVETIGEKKEQTVRDAVAKDKMQQNPVTAHDIIITESGNTLCYDVISGRYFKSDIEKIKKAENELNRLMRDDMYISLNDFYFEIGLRDIKLGDDLGWNIQDGYIDLNFSSQLASDGTPCLVIDYNYGPKYDYRQLM